MAFLGAALSNATDGAPGVPAMLGAKLMMEKIWMQPGVWNCEQLDPDPFMSQIGKYGLPWEEVVGVERV